MKRKTMTILLTGALAAAMAGTAYAAPTKTATLNNAQVRFNGGAVQTLQCYNIDGYNYVRARDITNSLNMALYPVQSGKAGVMVDTLNQPTSNATPEKLTQKTAQVQVQTGELVYDGMPSEAECFLLNGRYYFKLADFQKASDNEKAIAIETTEFVAKGGIATEPYETECYGISVEWNADSKVIDVKRTETDLWTVFNNIRGGKTETTETTKTEEKKADEGKTTVAEQTKGTGVLKAAPKEGEILANILIDKSKGAYVDQDFKVPNTDNFQEIYTYASAGSIGQCTWYARGRLVETYGDIILQNKFTGDGVENWVKNAQKAECPNLDGTTNAKDIVAGCIAVFKGHALFVEWVDYDDNGNPVTVYFTEANTGHDGVYRPEQDGKVKVMDFDDFIVRQPFVGYVIVK